MFISITDQCPVDSLISSRQSVPDKCTPSTIRLAVACRLRAQLSLLILN